MDLGCRQEGMWRGRSGPVVRRATPSLRRVNAPLWPYALGKLTSIGVRVHNHWNVRSFRRTLLSITVSWKSATPLATRRICHARAHTYLFFLIYLLYSVHAMGSCRVIEFLIGKGSFMNVAVLLLFMSTVSFGSLLKRDDSILRMKNERKHNNM